MDAIKAVGNVCQGKRVCVGRSRNPIATYMLLNYLFRKFKQKCAILGDDNTPTTKNRHL